MKILVAIIVCIALIATTFGITWRDAYSGIESVVSVTSNAVEKISSAFLPNAFKEGWNNVEQGDVNGIDVKLHIKNMFRIDVDFELADNVYKIDNIGNETLYYCKIHYKGNTIGDIGYATDDYYMYLSLNGTIFYNHASYRGIELTKITVAYIPMFGSINKVTDVKSATAYEQDMTVGEYLRGLNNE